MRKLNNLNTIIYKLYACIPEHFNIFKSQKVNFHDFFGRYKRVGLMVLCHQHLTELQKLFLRLHKMLLNEN